MAGVLLDSDIFKFNDGNGGGHACALGSAPGVGETDVLLVNSNTTVSTPSGFTAAESAVTNQGAYIFTRKASGGESDSVTIVTNGNHETSAIWSRWSGLDAVDTSTSTQTNGSAVVTTPAHTTGTLSTADQLVIAFGATHNIGAAHPQNPVWANSYVTLVTGTSQGTGASGVVGFSAYKQPVGTSAEAPSVTWTNSANDAYMLAVTFTITQAVTTTRRPRRMTAYIRGTEGRLNQILDVLGTTKPSLWPFWEPTGQLVTGISPGDLIPSETAAAAESLEDDFAPVLLPCGLYSLHFHPTGDHHLAGVDHANYSFGNGTVDSAFSVGAWIRPNAIASNTIIAKYDSAGSKEEYRLWIDASGLLDLELHDASASATEIAVSASALTVGQWVFVAASYDGEEATPAVWLYVNGAAVNDGSTTESGSYVAMEDTTAPLTIGCGGVSATPTTEFHGRIALPFITGKALTAAEVQQLHALTAPMVGIS